MTFYMMHDGRMFKVHTDVGSDPDTGRNENTLCAVTFEEITQPPQWESMEPCDEEFEP